MSTSVSNVTISFPPHTTLPGDAAMTVACTIDGLPAGQTPQVMFPGAAMPTDMDGAGTSWSATSAPEMFSAGPARMTIASVAVSFDLKPDGTAENIKVG